METDKADLQQAALSLAKEQISLTEWRENIRMTSSN